MKDIRFVRYGSTNAIKQKKYKANKKDMGFHEPPAKKGLYAFIEHFSDRYLLSGVNEPTAKNPKSIWIKNDDGQILERHYSYIKIEEYLSEWEQIKTQDKELYSILKKKKYKLKNVLWFDKFKCPYKSTIVDEIKDKEYDFFHEVYKDEYARNCSAYDGSFSITEVKGYDPNKVFDCEYRLQCDEEDGIKRAAYLNTPKTFTHIGVVWHHFVKETPQNEVLCQRGDWVKTEFKTFVKAFHKFIHNSKKEYLHNAHRNPFEYKKILQYDGDTENLKYLEKDWDKKVNEFNELIRLTHAHHNILRRIDRTDSMDWSCLGFLDFEYFEVFIEKVQET